MQLLSAVGNRARLMKLLGSCESKASGALACHVMSLQMSSVQR